jgi:YHS domain-containing protein
MPGDKICPISKTKANEQFAWVIDGKNYTFCCPPCIDEYVKLAKEQPEALESPDSFIKE